jgi:hypothetical protein
VQQRDRHAGLVGLAMESPGERGAHTAATLAGLDEQEHQVGRGCLADHRRDPVRGLGPLRRQHSDGLAVALGQPGPRGGAREQADDLLL